MQHWSRKKGMMGDDPPYLTVGTEVSAKYKGAFCEAKVRKVVRSVKCKVTFKLGLGTAIITDDQIRGTLRVGAVCEVKHPEKKEYVEATINKIQDCSQYTVVFDDGDITTLRRTALCLKSGRHFAESETLDQLPLTHPEHFGNPVIGGRKGRRSRQTHEDSSDDEGAPKKGKKKEEKEADIGKVVCVELGDKKKQKDNWFPGLVVAPTAQDTVRIRVKDEYLVRSFKDGRYFTVPKKEATEFTREIGAKVDNNTLRTAVEKALMYLDKDELPPHWDRDLLFGMDESSGNSDSDGGLDSDSSDDEPREEKDHFVAQLYKFMDDRGTPINKGPVIGNRDVDLYKLFKVVHKLGGYNRVTNQNQWKIISHKLGFGQGSSSIINLVKQAYKKFLHSFEDFYRKLGCTMVNHPRGNRSRHRSGRSLIRDRDRATPIHTIKEKEKARSQSSEKARSQSTEKSGTQSAEKMGETAEKSTPQADKKEVEKPAEEKEKPEESYKVKEQKKDKTKTKDDKPETASKEDKKAERGKVKDEEPPVEKSKNKEEKSKAAEVKEAVEEKDDRLRTRETRKDDKAKESRSKAAVAATLQSTSAAVSETDTGSKANESKASEEHPKSRQSLRDVTPSVLTSDEASCSDEKTKSKEDKAKLKETKPKAKDAKSKKDEKAKSVDRFKTKEEKTEVKVKEEKIKEEKVKEEKVKEEKIKDEKMVLEEEKPEESKKKVEKKVDDEEKQTRSKSKDEMRQKKDTVTPERRSSDSRTPSRDSEKRIPIPLRPKKSEEEMAVTVKKRGRKRKDTDEKNKGEESLGQLASYITVGLGDKLKVYYGPTHESKVTYEAKVIEISMEDNETVYRVHYTGWNTRYDEWIKRGRIADNLSWTPSRAKRLRHQQAQAQLKAAKPMGKRGRPSLSSKTQDLPNVQQSQPPRSTTPSSVTSSSSRTKSPATSRTGSTGGRVTRNTSESSNIVSPDFRRRTRRMSGHTDDISIASESESEDFESESEMEPTQTRSKTERKSLPLEKEDTKDESLKIDVKKLEKPFRRKPSKRKDDEEEDDKVSIKEEDNNIEPSPEPDEVEPQEKRRSKRTKKAAVTSPEKKEQEIKEEVTVKQELGAECEEEQPKGRDFDLNQIRSELKGIEKAVKLPQDIMHRSEETNSQMIIDEKPENDDKVQEEEEEMESKNVEKQPKKREETSTEDIYEFKEPEPFELEVRSKRDILLSEDRSNKLNRRSRFFDDVVESKTDKPPRKKLVRSVVPVTKVEGKEDSPFEGESRRRFRRTPTKKTDNIPEPKKKDIGSLQCDLPISPIKPLYTEPVTPQKIRPLSACEEAFDKLCESPSYQVASKSSESNTPSPKTSKSPEIDLSLFSELPGEGGEDDGEDDSEDRLVISETDETETEAEEPLFTYSQRHHEEIFPTLVGSESSAATVPEITTSLEQITPLKTSPDPPRLLPMAPDIFTAFSSRPEVTTKVEDSEKPATCEETEKMAEEPLKSAGNVDVMKLLMKGDEDDYEDDPINAAIQRVIEQSMTDEESNDMDIFGTKETVCSLADLQPEPVAAQEESLPPAETPRKETPSKEMKRKNSSRKPVLSKEFVEDSDSNSDSDEGERLVIAKVDDDDASNSSSQSSLKLHVSESSDTEMKLRLNDKDEDIKVVVEEEKEEKEKENKNNTEEMPAPSPVKKEEPPQNVSEEEKLEQSESKTAEEEVTVNVKPENEQEEAEKEENVTKTEELEEKEEVAEDVEKTGIREQEKEEEMKVVPESVDTEIKDAVIEPKVDVTEEKEEKVKDNDEALPSEKREEEGVEEEEKSSEEGKCEEEVESNVQSLLCEETIPGSPNPVSDTLQSVELCQEEPEDSKSTVLEMPFASAPGNNCSATTSSSTNTGKITPLFASAPLAESSVPVTLELPAPVEAEHTAPSSQEVPVPLPVVVAGPGPIAVAAAAAAAIVVQGPSPSMPKRNSNEAAPVMDNTPPTTPDSSLSTISGSPREERDGMSPTMDNESSKSHRDSFEIDLDSCAEGNKVDHYSEEDSLLNIEVSNSSDNRLQGLKLLPKKQDADKEAESSPKKRRRSRKRSECESNKRSRHSSGKATRSIGGSGNGGAGSDSDDTSENSTAGGCTPLTSTENVLSSRSPRPSKYNFYVELDPELDGTQRIALLQQKLQELRKTYMNVKAELACIDRRRKKLRRREREGEIPRIIKN